MAGARIRAVHGCEEVSYADPQPEGEKKAELAGGLFTVSVPCAKAGFLS